MLGLKHLRIPGIEGFAVGPEHLCGWRLLATWATVTGREVENEPNPKP